MHMFSWLKKYFVPHHKNDYKPHFLRYQSMLLVMFLVVIVEVTFLVQVFVVFDKTNFLASVLPGVLTALTNEERAQNDAPPLSQNNLLKRAAELKAQDMANGGYFAHTSPDGKTPWYWLDQVGYTYKLAGENLAVNFFESTDVAEAWMNSPTHRANIVKKNYTEIGIGVANGKYEGKNTVFVAQFFGTPIDPVKNVVAVAPINNQPNVVVPTPQKTKSVVPIKKPKPNTPVVAPKATAVAPTEVQVLGEEINSSVVVNENITLVSFIKSFVQKVVASPREHVAYVYSGIALVMIFALLLAIFIKKEIQHPDMVGRGVAIVAIIFLLMFINIKIFNSDTKVPTEGLEAAVIAY